MLGKQYRHCPNCGKQLYDAAVCEARIRFLCCSDLCAEEFLQKQADCMIGIDAPFLDEVAIAQSMAKTSGSWYPGMQRNLRP